MLITGHLTPGYPRQCYLRSSAIKPLRNWVLNVLWPLVRLTLPLNWVLFLKDQSREKSKCQPAPLLQSGRYCSPLHYKSSTIIQLSQREASQLLQEAERLFHSPTSHSGWNSQQEELLMGHQHWQLSFPHVYLSGSHTPREITKSRSHET